MLSRQCEQVHRRYTADQETAPNRRSTRFAGEPPLRSGFSQNPTPPVLAVRGNSSRVRAGERERRPGWHLSIHLHREAVQHWYNRPPRKG